MKKILLIAIFAICYVSVNAQDIIKTKDNTEVLSKVIEIGETSVKYKKWENLSGPTYTMSISKISSIIYQNGSVESFTNYVVEKSDVATSIDIAGEKVSTSVQTSGNNISRSVGNVARQQDLYAKARVLKTCGFVLGGLTFAGCLVWGIAQISDSDGFPWAPVLVGGIGTTAIMAAFVVPANELEAKAESLSCYNLVEYEINDNIALNAKGFRYNPTNTSFYGVGVSMKF